MSRTVDPVSLTGVIYGGIVVLWLCYLVPLALRRYDDASRSRSVERFSTAMRVLGRTERTGATSPSRSGPAPVSRIPARTAARRRRRVLGVLLVATAATAVACYVVPLAWWVLSIPAGLVVLFLVVARLQVARAPRRARRTAPVAQVPAAAPRPEPVTAEPVQSRDFSDPDDAPTEVLDPVQPAPVASTDGGSLWDPLPVTLPTYVTKARATRTVRTIDLSGPGVWTSGRQTEDEAPAVPEPQQAEPEDADERARAVGD